MDGLGIQQARLPLGMTKKMEWRPFMGQPVTTVPTTPPSAAVPAKAPFIDSALVSLMFDIVGATANGILAYGSAVRGNKLTYLFGGMAFLFGVKGIADLVDVRNR